MQINGAPLILSVMTVTITDEVHISWDDTSDHQNLICRSQFHKLIYYHSDIKLIWNGCEIDLGLVYETGSCSYNYSLRLISEYTCRLISEFECMLTCLHTNYPTLYSSYHDVHLRPAIWHVLEHFTGVDVIIIRTPWSNTAFSWWNSA